MAGASGFVAGGPGTVPTAISGSLRNSGRSQKSAAATAVATIPPAAGSSHRGRGSAIAARLRADLWPALSNPSLPRPMIARFPLTGANDAHRAVEARNHRGKALLLTDFGIR